MPGYERQTRQYPRTAVNSSRRVVHTTRKAKRQVKGIYLRRRLSGNYKRRNPILESIIGGAAAGTAAVLAGAALARRQRKPNSERTAAELFEEFHGRPATEVIDYQEALMASGVYTALGDDPELWLEPVKGEPGMWPTPDIAFTADDEIKLVTDPGGRQLYFVGDNQALPPEYFDKIGLATSKRFVNLGKLHGIGYKTEKVFDGYKSTIYAHQFGEENGIRPELVYDQETETLLVVGGDYSIAPLDNTLKASPGIVN